MSPPGRPKGEFRRAQPAGTPVSPPGRPKGEFRRAQPAGTPVSPHGRPQGEFRRAKHGGGPVSGPASPHRKPTSGALRRGFSLVELMVGLSIGLFLVAVMGAVYLGSRNTFVVQEAGSRMQENGRFAIDTISTDLRMSGFRGCQGTDPLDNTLNSPTALLYNFAEPIWGAHHTGVAWSPALAAPADTLSALAQGDVLVVRRPVGLGWSLIGEMANASAPLVIGATTNITQGDLLVLADCAGGAVLQATNSAPGTGGSIAHVTAAAGVVPGVARNALTRIYANDARVWRMQTLIYFIANSVRRPGQTALWVFTSPVYDGGAQRAELVTGVERLAVTYGVDSDGDFSADQFRSADQVSNWAQVVSARVELLQVADSDSRATTTQPFKFGGETITPTDQKLRSVMSTLVSLRNAVP